MISCPISPSWSIAPVALGLLVSVSAAPAQDDPQVKRRLELMQAAVANLEVKSSELKPKSALTAGLKPLLRYNDPTRGGVGVNDVPTVNVLLDAGVWRLGTEGRPTALVTLEIYRGPNGHVLSYEFLSLTPTKFSLKHKSEDVGWDATGSGLELKPLPDAPNPAATAPARLAQMRQLARRFSAKEKYNEELVECRLIAQPIDRYSSDAEKIVDGAIFALANGTNPEIGIVLEADATGWRYGALRLTTAETTVALDGKQVAAFEKFSPRGRRDGPYIYGSHKFEMGK